MYNVIRTATLDGLSDSQLARLLELLRSGYEQLSKADVSERPKIASEQLIDELLTPSRN